VDSERDRATLVPYTGVLSQFLKKKCLGGGFTVPRRCGAGLVKRASAFAETGPAEGLENENSERHCAWTPVSSAPARRHNVTICVDEGFQ